MIRTKARTSGKRGRSTGPEGRLWEEGADAIGEALPDVPVIHVSDRESDVFSYFEACRRHGAHFVVRARWDRKLADDFGLESGERLLQKAREIPANPDIPWLEVKVDASAKQVARTAHLSMSWQTFTVRPPQYSPPDSEAMKLTLVRVWEAQAPAGTKALEWLLVTDLHILSIADALRIRKVYITRWLIEDFHMAIKTGCAYEHAQFDNVRDLTALLGFVAPLAVRLVQLRYMKDLSPDAPAAQHEDPLVVALVAQRYKKPVSMTLLQFWKCIAQLGGYVGNWAKHPPGWRILWSGYLDAIRWAEGARLMQHLPQFPN